MPPKTAPNPLHVAQGQRVRPEHECNTFWSERALTGDRQTAKAGLVWTRRQARLSVQDCSAGHARVRSTSRPSEEKLDGQCERVDILLIDKLLSEAHKRMLLMMMMMRRRRRWI
ncbi:hypothetical protein DPMN_096634 [Dreissena polymorpha]|uniref:Uncharacterized protein n=1 Tax=Dreissena polymorpha TaxID=45954 RepID=A0A9D4L9R9_DREPO|nr:hypothetical protein DPMN_096634 [Dreissena polymorpha]